MKTSKQYLERQEWDLRLQVADRVQAKAQANEQNNATVNDRSNPVKQLWRRFINVLVGKTDLQVWQSEANGQTYWQAYDPVSHEFVTRGSEDEMRAWIETRYYNHTDAAETFHQRQYQLWALR